ncbi:MAG: hypothetical protein C4341_09355 [Armatimonadota bacterium]
MYQDDRAGPCGRRGPGGRRRLPGEEEAVLAGLSESRLRALTLAEGKAPTAANIRAIAEAVSAEDAAWAFTQWQLRERARAKFPTAERMLFTREALEQATPAAVARYHASRFPEGELVADLTVGIGGDLVALAQRGSVVAFELDEERALCAEWNTGVRVRREDALAAQWHWNYAFCDPSRRRAGMRLVHPSEFMPNPVEVAQRMAGLRLGGIKLSPMLSEGFLQKLGDCIEFVSYHGECVEALIWIGKQVKHGVFAVKVKEDGTSSRLNASVPLPTRRGACRFVFDADPAAARSHTLGALCVECDLHPLADSVGYLTGEQPVSSPWLRGYRVLADAPARERALRAEARKLGARVAEVKSRVRGTERFRWVAGIVEGARQVTAMLYPRERSVRVLLVEPLDAWR